MLKPTTVLVAGLLVLAPASSEAQRILAPRLDPGSPATLEPGERVSATVRFRTPERRKVRVLVRPLTDGRLTRGYAGSGSPTFPSGVGTAEGWFTVREAPVRVDAVRVQMVDAASGEVLSERIERVEYRFGPEPPAVRPQAPGRRLAEVQPARPQAVAEAPSRVRPELRIHELSPELLERLGRYRPPAWRLPEGPEGPPGGEDDDEPPPCFEVGIETLPCERVVSRNIAPGGDVEVRCANGTTRTTTTGGSEIYTAPDGRRCSLAVLYSTALPPAEPPEAIGDSEWAGQVNEWLGGVADRLLQRIQILVGPEGVENYRDLEDESTGDLYQKVDLRLAYLDRLMEHL